MCADTSLRFHAVLLHQLDQSYMYHYTRNAYEFHSAPSDMSPDELIHDKTDSPCSVSMEYLVYKQRKRTSTKAQSFFILVFSR